MVSVKWTCRNNLIMSIESYFAPTLTVIPVSGFTTSCILKAMVISSIGALFMLAASPHYKVCPMPAWLPPE